MVGISVDERNERTRRSRRINGPLPEERRNDTKRMPSKAILPKHLTLVIKSRPKVFKTRPKTNSRVFS
jgi:hypothetical protein